MSPYHTARMLSAGSSVSASHFLMGQFGEGKLPMLTDEQLHLTFIRRLGIWPHGDFDCQHHTGVRQPRRPRRPASELAGLTPAEIAALPPLPPPPRPL